MLAIVAQLAEDGQREEQRLQLRDARDEVRAAYRASSLSGEADCWAQFEALVADLHGSELSAVDGDCAERVGQRTERSEAAERFDALERRAAALIERVAARAGPSAGASAASARPPRRGLPGDTA